MAKQSNATPTRRPLPATITNNDIIVLYSEHLLGFDEQWLQHDFVKIVIVDGGSGNLVIDQGQSLVLQEGDMLLIPSQVLHRWRDDQGHPLRLVIICCAKAALLSDLHEYLSVVQQVSALNSIIGERHKRFAHQLLQEQARQEFAWQGKLSALIHHELIQIIRAQVATTDPLMQDIARYIEQHLSDTLSIQALAKRCAMSYRSFTTHFKQSVGLTCQQYQRKLRIRAAEDLLVSGIPILHIALELGYSDVSNFYKAFRQVHDCAPGLWLNRRLVS